MNQATIETRPVTPEAWEIRTGLSILRLLEIDGVEMSRSGPAMIGLCPFHSERSPSFTWSRSRPNTVHCFGCGWHGDIFKYWQERIGCDFKEAAHLLAGLAGMPNGSTRSLNARPKAAQPSLRKQKPRLPTLREGTDVDLVKLAALRGLSVESLRAARSLGLLRFAMWPDWRDDAAACWVISDDSRNVAQFRRLDGEPFQWSEERQIKAWTKGSPNWPVGCADGKRNILLVEGGPDLLAAIQFLLEFNAIDQVCPLAMFGASCNISEEAMSILQPPPSSQCRRVRILKHADAAGDASADRWTTLTAAGCAVDVVSVADLSEPDWHIKDVNDLARSDWRKDAKVARLVRRAFMNWDF